MNGWLDGNIQEVYLSNQILGKSPLMWTALATNSQYESDE